MSDTIDKTTADTVDTTEAAATGGTPNPEPRLYRLTRGTHGRHESDGFRVYSAKTPETATMLLTADEAKQLGDRVTLVEGDIAAGQYTEGVSVTRVEADTDPGDEVLTGPPAGVGTDPAIEVEKEAVKEAQGGDTGAASGDTGDTSTSTTKQTKAGTTGPDGSYGLDSLSWSDAKDVIMALETPQEVRAAKKEEEGGKGRKSVLDAADARLEQLKG